MSDSLSERDKRYIWHPYTSLSAPAPVPIVKGRGAYLIDEGDNFYLDAISSWWVTIHGHAHPYIAERLYRQALELEQVIFANFTHRPAVELAEYLVAILPLEVSKVFYSDNGSTATEVAIKMALQYWWNQKESAGLKRTKILAFHHGYHGDTFGAMSISGRSVFTEAFNDKLFDVIFIDTPEAATISQIRSIVEEHAEEIAAFIYEPLLQGSGGMRMYEPGMLNELLLLCQQHDIICIADEVMTGFGRTGKLFASSYMTAIPDIICLSKGLTGGTMALGVTACNAKIESAFISEEKMKTFFHGHSFTANPLACTAALASIDLLLQQDCLDRIDWISASNKEFVKKLEGRAGIKNARSLGTIAAFELSEGKDGYLNTAGKKLAELLMQQGIFIRPLGNTVYIMPPYCIREEELEGLQHAILAAYSA
ncbi:MAG: adenosylmethionine--8-amino-7-oxononanoate transaminase [Chitinophagaceae bacterium]|nr:adenosylmethionine--8-amino-7-oxononanoate transaminase [Chitinophagaceae bacterium]